MSPSQAKKTHSPEVKKAEKKVEKSTAQFETAMDHLENKIEGTTHKVQQVKDLVKKPQQMARRLMRKVQPKHTHYRKKAHTAVSPFRMKATESSRMVVAAAKEHPKTFALGTLAVIGSVITGVFLSRRSE